MAAAQPIADTPEAREVAELVARSRAAQAQIADYTQEQVDRLIRGMVWAVAKEATAEKIAQHTVDETQLGNYDGKYLKIFRKTRATLMDIIDDKSVGVIEEDKARNIVKIAKPIGVIGALSPSTNPEATPVIKAISAVKGRNSIIIAPHPRAKITNKMICDLMREALVKMGAPADLVIQGSLGVPPLRPGHPGARRRRGQCGGHCGRYRRSGRRRREDPHFQDAGSRRLVLVGQCSGAV